MVNLERVGVEIYVFVRRKALLEVQSGNMLVHGPALANVDQGISLGVNDEPAGGIHVFAGGVVEGGEVGELGDSTKGIGHEPLAVLREARDELVGVKDTLRHNDTLDGVE